MWIRFSRSISRVLLTAGNIALCLGSIACQPEIYEDGETLTEGSVPKQKVSTSPSPSPSPVEVVVTVTVTATPVASTSTTTSVIPDPAAPDNLQISNSTGTTINLTWTDNASNETAYNLERCDGSACQSTFTAAATASLAANSITYTATGLTAGQAYRFRIRATNDGGTSSWITSPITLAFKGLDSVTPLGATDFTFDDCAASSVAPGVKLSWTNLGSALTYLGYQISSGAALPLSTLTAPTATYKINGLTANTSYTYRLRMTDTNGIVDHNTNDVAVTTTSFNPCVAVGHGGLDQFDRLQGFYNPRGLHTDGTKLFLADYNNSRILIWNTIPTANQTAPNVVLGLPAGGNGANSSPSVAANRPAYPNDVFSDGTKLFVADSGNHRVLIWNSIPTSNYVPADVVLGQPTMTSNISNSGGGLKAQSFNSPASVYSTGTKLFVVDYYNNRILVWNSIPTSNYVPADLVLGQPNMTSNASNNGGITAQSLSGPYMVSGNGTKLFVSDFNNHRLLIWNALPTTNQQAADVVLGQPNMTSNTANNGGRGASTLYYPFGADSDGTKLYVADRSNYRILIWDTIPTANGAAANTVIGQADMTSATAAATAQGLYNIGDVAVGGSKLIVSDDSYHRIKIWNSIPTANHTAADVVLGQPNMTTNIVNHWGTTLDGKTLYQPTEAVTDGTKLLVTDVSNQRVLIWNSIPNAHNTAADVVLGQPNMSSNTVNNGGAGVGFSNPYGLHVENSKLYVADLSNNRVLIWNSIPTANQAAANVVLGQPNLTSTAGNNGGRTASTLSMPIDVHSDGTKLYVSDYANSRVLIWNALPTSNQVAADVVLGQADMTSGSANRAGSVAANTLNYPRWITTSGTKLLVADTDNRRILIWNTIPTTNGVAADVVVGQVDMTSNTASVNHMNNPWSAAVNAGKLYVSDTNSHRILVWNSIPTSNGVPPDDVIGQGSGTTKFTTANISHGGVSYKTYYTPAAIFFNGSRMYVTDHNNYRVLITPVP